MISWIILMKGRRGINTGLTGRTFLSAFQSKTPLDPRMNILALGSRHVTFL
jgi:hypothetical protein